ncbi:MAG: right-handed parallel beta-helix repeat-containing protein [Kiritimatiellae bacterium]|nr:right-handed parallel beta-helix repeat-containing protein [Kiritimatiellia bacterium]
MIRRLIIPLIINLILITAYQQCAFAQGTLNPPTNAVDVSGNPQAFMKTLDQIEPRTLISHTPYLITEAGSYYLIGNLLYTNTIPTNGITIAANAVRLDMRGFSLIAATGSESGHGIHVAFNGGTANPRFNISIRSGVVRGWGGSGIDTSWANDSQIKDIKSMNNAEHGIHIGEDSSVESCLIRNNGSSGLEVGGGGTIRDCKVHENGKGESLPEGIYANSGSKITGCTANNNRIGIWVNEYSTVRDCTVLWNDDHGIHAGSACRIEDNNCGGNANGTNNSGAGIYVTGSGNRIEGNNLTDNNRGIFVDGSGGANLIVRNSASGNTADSYLTGTDDYFGSVEDSASMGTNGFVADPWANFEF